MLKSLAIVMLLMVSVATRAAEDTDARLEQLDKQVQTLKSEMLELSTEISRVEQQIYPEESTVKLFLAVQSTSVKPVSASVYINDRLVGSHLYTDNESRALMGGGIQELYKGFIVSGDHKLEVKMIVQAGDEQQELDAQLEFNKSKRKSIIELTMSGGEQGATVLELTRK